jgi:hypothetical protein
MKMLQIFYKSAIYIFLLIFLAPKSFACNGGVNNQGTLTPTLVYQTIATMDGNYYTMNVVCGNTYNFDFCANGGSSGSLFPEISILDVTGFTQYAFSPYSGGCSSLNWIATFTGSIRILITDSGCFQGQSYSGTMAYRYNTGAPINPSFTLTESCGGGSSTITGTSGGTFAFNPAPGDGAQINNSTGLVSNGSAGTTYFVEYTVCGSSSIESVLVLTDDCFTLNGSAQYISVLGEDCIQLTQEINDQTGCAWNGAQVDFNSNFSLSLNYYFGNNVNGADGNTFTFQPSSSNACGQNGGQLGAGGLINALSVEFDTYDNDNPAHVYDMSCDHVAIEIDGNMLGPGAPFSGPVCAKSGGGNIDDGGTYNVEIEWNAALQQLNVFFDGDLRLSSTSDFVNTAFGGQNLVYWGATSATGGLNNQQYFCPSTVIVLPAELVSFSSVCEGDKEEFVWTTASEDRVDYFEIEYTTDGFIFYPVGQIKAAGSSSTTNHYRLESQLEGITQRYYRIKTVDEDGNFETSEMIAGKNCKSPSLIHNYTFENGQFHIETSVENVRVQLLTTTGQELFSYDMKDELATDIINLDLAQGVYILTVQDLENGKRETLRLFYVKN